MAPRLQRTLSPIDGSVAVTRELADAAALERVLDAAQRAQSGWQTTALDERRQVVRRMVDAIVANADAIGQELALQMGRPVRDGPKEIRGGFAERALAMADLAPAALAAGAR